MFKFIFSFIYSANTTGDITTTSTTSNTSNADKEPIVKGVNDEETAKDSPSIQSVRQQRQQQLEETALIRKIAHQSFMNHYAVDHLPLSQVQEKLEEDNIPLVQLQEKLKQRNDDLTVYTTTKESLKSLFYNQGKSHGLIMKPKKFRPTTVTASSNDDDKDDDNNNNNNNNNSNPTKDDRDYDVWDDAVIGRLMNLIDTIGKEPEEAIQGTESTSTNDDVTGNEHSTFSENTSGNAEEVSESNDPSKDKETIVAEDVQEDCETQSIKVAEKEDDETSDVADDHDETMGNMGTTVIQVTTLTTTYSVDRSEGVTRDSGFEDNITSLSIESNNKRESGFFRKRRSILSPTFFHNKNQSHSEFPRNGDDFGRKYSIDSMRSITSFTSVASVASVTSVTSKVSTSDFDNRKKSSKSFLKKLWKSKRQQGKVDSCDRLVRLQQSSDSLNRKYYNQ